MSEEKVRRLVRWNRSDARAIAEQLLERVRVAQAEGLTVGVVTCFVHADADADGVVYEVGISTLPVEVALWAAKKIEREIIRIQEEEND